MNRAAIALGQEPGDDIDDPIGDESTAGLWADRWVGGGSILDQPPEIPALWGEGDDVLWAEGEGLMIAAPQGVGKTTIGQQVVAHGIGIRSGPFLGLPVREMRRVLYLAMDRPRQAQRSFGRMVEERHRALLDERLVIWQGPPPESIVARPELLMMMAQEAHADVLVIDSLKDVAPGLSSDEVGAAVNTALQHVIAAGVDVLALHHTRKGSRDSSASGINGVYGSTWLTSGMGSVLSLEGEPGSTTIKAVHTKQPAEPVGPLTLQHEHRTGTTAVDDEQDPLRILIDRKSVTVSDFAAFWLGVETPNRSQKERARRKLEGLVKDGFARPLGGEPAMYEPVPELAD